jgi:hypothetical protein
MSHCKNFHPAPASRRDFLQNCGIGFGTLAFQALLQDKAFAGVDSQGKDRSRSLDPLSPRKPHHKQTAKSVIFLYMDGGVSHVDSFDPKPMLDKHNGEDPYKYMRVQPTQFNNIGSILASPWKFKPGGKSGLPVSDLFPFVRECADDLCVIRSMTAKFPEHTNANYFLHTGSGLQGRPSMGAWATYGLGSNCQDLPGFVVINSGLTPPGGLDNFNSGYLPAAYQGSIFRPSDPPIANSSRADSSADLQEQKMSLVRKLDQLHLQRSGKQDILESAITNHELAYRMQLEVPGLMDVAGEPQHIRDLYGLDHQNNATKTFANACLMARRLVQRGVRFIELTCPGGSGDRWDQHGGLRKGHEGNALSVDQPIAGLLKDLKQQGLLDETLVVWTGEFGRTPFAQGRDGRDHHPYGFSLWMAGGGIKGGITFGATDEFGYNVVEDKLEIYDLHATMLHVLGLDHERTTFRFSGRDMRLTDVHGHVIHEILA